MLRNYNYMLTIILYPFIMALSYLKLINNLKGDFYTYLIIILLFIFIPSFIMSLYCALEEIFNSKKRWRVIILVLFSIFYLPIYYTKYVAKEEKFLGFFLFVISLPLTAVAYLSASRQLAISISKLYRNYVVINENYVQFASNKLFSINVDKTFRCSNQDIGDYVISCDRLQDDSFIGIYSYDVTEESEDDLEDKFEFHIGQTIDYIEDGGYTYEIIDNGNENIAQVDYNNNTILISQSIYELGSKKYSLIVLKEMPKELVDYEEYQKMIDSIYFLNYNDGVSS